MGFVLRASPRKAWEVTPEMQRAENNAAAKRSRLRNLERARKSVRDWGRRNRKSIRAYLNNRYYTDPEFNLVRKLRRRISSALRKSYLRPKKSASSIALLGCTFAQVKEHIEKQFTAGMTWSKCFNGEIHFDHVRPCSSYDLTDPAQQRACFHYTNLQPLWAKDNLQKGDRWNTELTPAEPTLP